MSYLKLLDKYYPRHTPIIGSIFELNGQPVIFTKEEVGWSNDSNVGVLCYYIVHGEAGILNSNKIEKWAELNCTSLLGKTIKEMNKRQREKKRVKKDQESKPLILFEGDHEEQHIW